MEIAAGIGAILAGLFLLLRSGPPLLVALRTGVLPSKAQRGAPIERANEPERFKALWNARARQLVLPIILIAGGTVWLAFTVALILGMQAQERARNEAMERIPVVNAPAPSN